MNKTTRYLLVLHYFTDTDTDEMSDTEQDIIDFKGNLIFFSHFNREMKIRLSRKFIAFFLFYVQTKKMNHRKRN